MPNKNGVVTEEKSPLSKSSEQLPSDEGKIPSKTDDRPEENVRLEIERKVQEMTAGYEERLKSYESQLAELKAEKEERLAELEEKNNLSAAEKAEIYDLEKEINGITADQRSKPWLEINKRSAEKVTLSILEKRDFDDAMEMVEELAEAEGIEKEKFEKELTPFLKPYAGMRFTKKVKAAYKDLQKKRALDKREADLKLKEEVAREGDGKPPRQQKAENFQDAAKSGNFASLLKSVSEAQAKRRVE